MKGFIIFTYLALKLIAAASFLYLMTQLIQSAEGTATQWIALTIYSIMLIVSIPLGAAINLMEDN